jgi:predicted GNAT family acetyltransferase
MGDLIPPAADAANPTSNGVYERLGFREAARVVELSVG